MIVVTEVGHLELRGEDQSLHRHGYDIIHQMAGLDLVILSKNITQKVLVLNQMRNSLLEGMVLKIPYGLVES